MSRPARQARIASRVVLDTNIVVSALVFRGTGPSSLRRAWQARVFQPLVSSVTAHELIRVLAYPKFRLSPVDQHELLADYLPYATTVTVPHPPPRVPRCRDSFDQCFLELALAGNAHAVVSGDQDLLALAGLFSLPVIDLAAFLETLQA